MPAPILPAVCTMLDTVMPQPVKWLWPGRVAMGKLTLLAGDPGLGKSLLTIDMAARLTQGRPWPDSPADLPDHPPCEVVLLSAEDDMADTIRPRLDKAGGAAWRVAVIQGVRRASLGGEPLSFNLVRDLAALEQVLIDRPNVKLVVIDPVTAYLGGTDSHNNADMRGLLAPLSDVASRRGVAVVAVTHLNKAQGGRAMYRAMGSLAFVAAARAAWLVTADRRQPGRRLLLPVKNNLAPDTSGLAFNVTDGLIAWEDHPVQMTADDALSEGATSEPTDRDDAAEWLKATLTEGPVPAKELFERAEAMGFSEWVVRRAAKDMSLTPRKLGGGGPWVWAAPEPAILGNVQSWEIRPKT